MEHRWGERVALRLTVELLFSSSPPVVGSLENVSSSGAFVRTAGRRPPRGPVEVILDARAQEDRSVRRQAPRLPAYVVRETDSGVGIEWCEFAPRAVRELIVRGRRAGGERARARAQRSPRHSAREANTAMHPRVQPPLDPAAIGTKTLPVA
ncbi:MAG: PilZ domain-containing protein [Steroidobacteraceae bacterium]